jgi:hypothetical protein
MRRSIILVCSLLLLLALSAPAAATPDMIFICHFPGHGPSPVQDGIGWGADTFIPESEPGVPGPNADACISLGGTLLHVPVAAAERGHHYQVLGP